MGQQKADADSHQAYRDDRSEHALKEQQLLPAPACQQVPGRVREARNQYEQHRQQRMLQPLRVLNSSAPTMR